MRKQRKAKDRARFEALRLERVRQQNAERQRRFQARKRDAAAARAEALIYEVEPA